MDLLRPRGDLDMALNRAAFLRQPGHIGRAAAFAFKMRRHREEGADGHDPGAADAGDENGERLVAKLRDRRLRQRRKIICLRRVHARGFQLGPVHRHHRRAEALEAGEILVAARLVDDALAAELGFERLQRDAVRDLAAIAATLADKIVDEDALVGIGELAALAAAALLRGAGLIVDEDRRARDHGELALHGVEFVAQPDLDVRAANSRAPDISAGSSVTTTILWAPSAATWRTILSTVRPPSSCWPPVIATASLKRILKVMLVPARDGPADRQNAGVIIGAVTEILDDMAARRERRLADPVGALAAHVGVALGGAVHALDHVMAADAGVGAHPLGHFGRGIVRAARAEIGRAHRRIFQRRRDRAASFRDRRRAPRAPGSG